MIVLLAALAVAGIETEPRPPAAETFDAKAWVYPGAQAFSVGGGRAGGGGPTNPHGHESFSGTWVTRASYADVVRFYEKLSGITLEVGGRSSQSRGDTNFAAEDSERRPVSLRILIKRLRDQTQLTAVISRADTEEWTHITLSAYREIVPRPQ